MTTSIEQLADQALKARNAAEEIKNRVKALSDAIDARELRCRRAKQVAFEGPGRRRTDDPGIKRQMEYNKKERENIDE